MTNQPITMSNLTSNPMFQMAQAMAKGKGEPELKQIAVNICKEKGLDLEQAYKEFQEFMKSIKGA